MHLLIILCDFLFLYHLNENINIAECFSWGVLFLTILEQV